MVVCTVLTFFLTCEFSKGAGDFPGNHNGFLRLFCGMAWKNELSDILCSETHVYTYPGHWGVVWIYANEHHTLHHSIGSDSTSFSSDIEQFEKKERKK